MGGEITEKNAEPSVEATVAATDQPVIKRKTGRPPKVKTPKSPVVPPPPPEATTATITSATVSVNGEESKKPRKRGRPPKFIKAQTSPEIAQKETSPIINVEETIEPQPKRKRGRLKKIPPPVAIVPPLRNQFKIAKENAKVPFLYHRLLECDNSSTEYTVKDHDITLRIPEGALPMGESVHFEIGVAAYGPFIFPGSSRPISPIVWLCILEDVELKKPFKLIVPHFLVGLNKERFNYHQVNFAKANHINYNDSEKVYRFYDHDCEHLFASTEYRSYGILSSTHCCFYCLLAKNTPELTRDAGYCLARIENILSPRRNEVYFAAIFFLDTCMKVFMM